MRSTFIRSACQTAPSDRAGGGGGAPSTGGANGGEGRAPTAARPRCGRCPARWAGCSPGTCTGAAPRRAGRGGPRRPRRPDRRRAPLLLHQFDQGAEGRLRVEEGNGGAAAAGARVLVDDTRSLGLDVLEHL